MWIVHFRSTQQIRWKEYPTKSGSHPHITIIQHLGYTQYMRIIWIYLLQKKCSNLLFCIKTICHIHILVNVCIICIFASSQIQAIFISVCAVGSVFNFFLCHMHRTRQVGTSGIQYYNVPVLLLPSLFFLVSVISYIEKRSKNCFALLRLDFYVSYATFAYFTPFSL